MKTNVVVCLVGVAFGLAFVRGQEDVCHLPVEKGPCRGMFPRWFFNSTTGDCERFVYGGCQGNANNFESQQECRLSCKDAHSTQQVVETSFEESCKPAAEPGLCDAYMPRWFFNVDTGACERFIYGGCGGNANNYLTFAECERTCLRRAGTRTYKITRFEFLGCSRFKNRVFRNKNKNCKVFPTADSGVCDAHIRRWFFNVKTGNCETFVYGGCGGNENNYKSRKDCEIACLRGTGLSVLTIARWKL
ncbi:unnamed protein product, partial [Ixodes persulcatus]